MDTVPVCWSCLDIDHHLKSIVLGKIKQSRSSGIQFEDLQVSCSIMGRKLHFLLNVLKSENLIKYIIPDNDLNKILYFWHDIEISRDVLSRVGDSAASFDKYLMEKLQSACLLYLKGKTAFHPLQHIWSFVIESDPIPVPIGLQDVRNVLTELIREGKVQAHQQGDGEIVYGITLVGLMQQLST